MRDPEIEKAAEQAREHYGQGKDFPNEGRLNVYGCTGKREFRPPLGTMVIIGGPCGWKAITIDREPGVTPFLIKCEGCGGDAQSSFYRVPANLDATHEWYRPDSFEGLKPGEIEHVKKGGLLLRRIEGEHPHRDPRWVRFQGGHAHVAQSPPPPGKVGVPTVGVGADICPDCERRWVLIACVAESGHEVNIGMSPESALLISDQIKAAALEVIATKGNG
jgi:hypothetical protein